MTRHTSGPDQGLEITGLLKPYSLLWWTLKPEACALHTYVFSLSLWPRSTSRHCRRTDRLWRHRGLCRSPDHCGAMGITYSFYQGSRGAWLPLLYSASISNCFGIVHVRGQKHDTGVTCFSSSSGRLDQCLARCPRQTRTFSPVSPPDWKTKYSTEPD